MKHISEKKNIITILFSFLLVAELSAQSLEWVKRGGGAAFDFGDGICTDRSGNMYVTGEYEFDSDFLGRWIACAGLHDIFVAKYNSAGVLLWLKGAGGIGGDGGHAIITDPDGNVYVTGEFEQATAFGNDTLKGLGTLNDIFVAKYDSSGVLQWVRKSGGWLADKGRGISTDAIGNVYITGEFKGTAYFDTVALVSSGDKDAFLLKYNAAGEMQWVKKIGGIGADDGKAVCNDLSGNIYVTGYFSDTADFGSNTALISSGGLDIYIAKYDSLGNLLWAKKSGGIYYDIGRGIAAAPSGMLYITGEFRYKASFDTLLASSNGKGDAFIACYDSSGNAKWVRNGGGNTDDAGNAIALDSSSNIYVTGQFGRAGTFGTTKIAGDSADIFVASYDSSGNFRWVQSAGSDTLDYGEGICVDHSGSAYVTGGFGHTAHFSGDSVKSSGHTEFFIARYSENLSAEPVNASSALTVNNLKCNSFQAGWIAGNGNKRLVLATKDSMASIVPLDGRSYNADSYFGSGSNLGNDSYVIYNDTGNTVVLTGLNSGTTYYLSVFEYSGSGVNTNYLTANYATAMTKTDSMNLSVSYTDTSVCSGSGIHLSASGADVYKWLPAEGLDSSDIARPLASPGTTTSYTVTGTSNTCIGTAVTTVNVNPAPDLFLGTDTIVCAGSSLVLDAGSGFANYTWSNGSHASNIQVDSGGVGLETTTYSVFVSNVYNCSVTDSIRVTYSPCTGIPSRNNEKKTVDIFPNPTNGMLYFQWNANKRDALKIEIYNAIGALVYEEEQNISDKNEVKTLDLKSMDNGFYILRIIGNKDSFSTGILIQK